MRILLTTNHLRNIAGSEVVTLEFATYFISLGHAVDVFANWVGDPMASLFAEIGINIVTDPSSINPLAYDLVYSQHHTAALFKYKMTDSSKANTLFVFGRLSRRSYLESGGWAYDNLLGDHVLANSSLTAERLSETGVILPVSVFHNAAPKEFETPGRSLPSEPRKILIVSNHSQQDVLNAISDLESVAEIRHLGETSGHIRRVTPADMQWADVVVSIGKTIQYALLSRTPAFVYDHFGGPGYLTAENFDQAAHFSFTGRCCERRLDGKDLAKEILENYHSGRNFMLTLEGSSLNRYRLDAQLDRILQFPGSSNVERCHRVKEARGAFSRDRMMSEWTRYQFVRVESLQNEVEAAQRELRRR